MTWEKLFHKTFPCGSFQNIIGSHSNYQTPQMAIVYVVGSLVSLAVAPLGLMTLHSLQPTKATEGRFLAPVWCFHGAGECGLEGSCHPALGPLLPDSLLACLACTPPPKKKNLRRNYTEDQLLNLQQPQCTAVPRSPQPRRYAIDGLCAQACARAHGPQTTYYQTLHLLPQAPEPSHLTLHVYTTCEKQVAWQGARHVCNRDHIRGPRLAYKAARLAGPRLVWLCQSLRSCKWPTLLPT